MKKKLLGLVLTIAVLTASITIFPVDARKCRIMRLEV